MNKICIHALAVLAGALGCTALADDTIDSPSRELLRSYTYQPEALAPPSMALPDAVNPAVFEPTVAPDFEAAPPSRYDWRDLEEAMALDWERRSHVLFAWDWRWNTQWQMLGRPDIQSINIPWSPMTTPNNSPFSSPIPDSATSKLQARFPLVSLVW